MKKISSLVLVLLWMIFIFIMSSFSAGESSRQSGLVVNFIANLFNISNLNMLSHIIRKLAHFTEYFVLGILVYNMMCKYHKLAYIGMVVCIIYAVIDEIHQIFVPGRSCQITDILIDIVAAIMAIIIFKRLKK